MPSNETKESIVKVSHAAFGPVTDWSCDIYRAGRVITTIDVKARTGTEAVEIAAQALKIKPKKNYNAK